jgi:hypothetical protein
MKGISTKTQKLPQRRKNPQSRKELLRFRGHFCGLAVFKE